MIDGKLIRGSVIHVDHFGNLVTNIPNTDFDRISAIEIAGTKILVKAGYYAEAPPDTLFFIAGSSGFIEIGLCGKSAAELLHSIVSDALHAHLEAPDSG
jgi:S-adenosylmethionine hydrolase